MATNSWFKYKFTYTVRKDLSKRLFEIYLNQPYDFYLNKNSAFLIRNIEEVAIYSDNINQIIILFTELLLLFGVLSILLIAEPFGAISVIIAILFFKCKVHSFCFNYIVYVRLG